MNKIYTEGEVWNIIVAMYASFVVSVVLFYWLVISS
jgi:hypothetical protein